MLTVHMFRGKSKEKVDKKNYKLISRGRQNHVRLRIMHQTFLASLEVPHHRHHPLVNEEPEATT